jgi:hypothetical protein
MRFSAVTQVSSILSAEPKAQVAIWIAMSVSTPANLPVSSL